MLFKWLGTVVFLLGCALIGANEGSMMQVAVGVFVAGFGLCAAMDDRR